MRILIFLFLFAFAHIHCGSNKDADVTSVKQEIKAVLMQQQKDWNNGNIEKFMEGYLKSDSLTFIGSQGITKGWNNTLTNYKKRYPDTEAMGSLTFEIISIDVISNETAILIGKYTLVRKQDNPSGMFTLVWKKVNNIWYIVSDHTC